MNMGTQTTPAYVKEKVHFNLAKMKKGGQDFEIVLKDPDLALELRHGKNIDVNDVLETPQVWKDAKKGEHQSAEMMKKWLGTENELEAAKKILKDGEVALTAEQRKRLFDQKKKKLIEYVHQNAADPKTKLPHPTQRIELAMEQAKVHIDPYIPIEKQMDKIIDQLRPIIPLSFEKAKLKVVLPSKYAGSAYANLKRKYKFQNEDWLNDGSVKFELEMPAGAKPDVMSDVNKLTNGEAEIEEVK